eukprot:CAMPEP_0201595752 /NCGR_PEP_ID=MMETSP0190_2-20130828/192645_1 /ASSEMBLY_ACC=CAM_ASM_000263 /TAXON_ID=37353 /ORGANISM="Rosalina sp." /LENGTH=1032 /DNA_ID=CAMNT_0048055839 /DNA_START=42 /DNA_END=3141 /DNA_ORIENTATION=+
MAAWVYVILSIFLSKLTQSQNPNLGPIQYLGPPLRYPPTDPNETPPRLVTMSPCPTGEMIVNCFVDPCRFATCPGVQGATCESNYCGGCNAIFKDPFTLKGLTQSQCHPTHPFPIEIGPIPPMVPPTRPEYPYPIELPDPIPPMAPPTIPPMAPPSPEPPILRPFPYPVPPMLPPSPEPPILKPCLMVYCFARPCSVSSCPAYPEATCADDYCGGCNAIYTDVDTGRELTNAECNGEPVTSPPIIRPLPLPRPVCTADVNECPDGSFVGRDSANNCQFKLYTDVDTGRELTNAECNGATEPPVIIRPMPLPIPRPVCTADVNECPDGSFVGRDSANNCQFKPCPISINPSPPLPANPSSCPSDTTAWPRPGSPCRFTGLCSYGEETCCGVTHSSYKCSCESGTTQCFYTDACMAAYVMGCDLNPPRPVQPSNPDPLPQPEPIPFPMPCTADAKKCPDGTYVVRDGNNGCEWEPCPSTTPITLPMACTYDIKMCPDGSYVGRDGNNGCEWEPCPSQPTPITLPSGCELILCPAAQHCCDNGMGGATCCPDNTLMPIPIRDNGSGGATCCPDNTLMPIPIQPLPPPPLGPADPVPLPVPELPTLPPACAAISCFVGTYCCPDGNGGARCCSRNPSDPQLPVPLPPITPLPKPVTPLPAGCMVIFCPAHTQCCDNGNGRASCCPMPHEPVLIDLPPVKPLPADPVPVPLPIDPSLPKPPVAILCTADVKHCPDGSYVHRDANNNCEFKECPLPTPISARPTILPKPIYCTMDVRQCPDGMWVSRDPSNGCQFKPCLIGIGAAPQAQTQPQAQISPVSGTAAKAAPMILPNVPIAKAPQAPNTPNTPNSGSILNAICAKVGGQCSIGFAARDRCCDSGHHGRMKCSLDGMDQNGNQIGTCCIKPKQSGCKSNSDCCGEDGICDIDDNTCKRDRNVLRFDAAQKVENNFDNFEMIKDTKGTKYMAISEATIIIIMIIILFMFPILYYVYYKKYIVAKIQQQARREVFHGLEINHSERSEFNDTSSDENNTENEQYVD